jgi:spermidine synthase
VIHHYGLLALAFFASGFAALVYQIVWQRLLVIFSGSDVYSATTIVAAFMAGLGCGSLAGAKIADRLSRAANLACFAAAEVAIAAFGFFSASLYYDVLYQRLGHLALGVEARSAILFLSLLWPTCFMGLSLPLLARALTFTIGRAASVTGWLYACNTGGAAAGAFVATWILVPAYGLEGTLHVAATLNIISAAATVPLALRMRARDTEPLSVRGRPAAATEREPVVPSVPFVLWAALYGWAGFVALSLEIVWFRLLGVMLKSTSFTFGTLLTSYLIGIGLGSALGAHLAARTRWPAHAFLMMQVAIGVYAGLSLAVLLDLIDAVGMLGPLAEYFGRYEPLDVRAAVGDFGRYMRGASDWPRQFFALYLVLPVVLIGPPTLLMGASFPFLQRAVQTDLTRLGHRVGMLLAANIAGSALGSILTGWIALTWLGTSGTLKLLVAATALFPCLGLALSARAQGGRGRLWTYACTIAAGAFTPIAMPDARSLWASVHGSTPAQIVAGEDASGTSVLRTIPGHQSRIVVFGNGLGQSWIPYGGIHTVLGALPAFIHPDPRAAAVVGLGSGDTVFGLAGRAQLERITCIEINRPQLATLIRLHETWPYPGLTTILRDSRIDHVYGDGRLYLLAAATRYDIIETDALRPSSAYSGNLYSDGYFALLRDRLKPGGLAVSWAPTERVHNTFVKVFPHVLSYGDIVIGTNEPLAFDLGQIRSRLSAREVQDYYWASGVDILTWLSPYLDRLPHVFGPDHDRSALVDINTDLFPRDEFDLGGGWPAKQ